MSLDLRNFVQVNINYHTAAVSSIDSGIVTLITVNSGWSSNPLADKILYSYDQYLKAKEEASITNTALDIYVKTFFDNGGRGIQIIGGYSSGEEADFVSGVVAKLNYKFVIITSDCSEEDMETVATTNATTNIITNPVTKKSSISTFTGINEKIFISSLANTTKNVGLDSSVKNFIIKMGKKGCEMLTAAFLSQVSVTNGASISDYNFTIENVKAIQDTIPERSDDFIVIDDNDTGVTLVGKNYNFDTNLVNAIRNIGGNTTGGADIMNYYIRILLSQSVTEKVLSVLVSKIKLNQSGINRVQNAIQVEMTKYINNGYLNTEFVWTEEDLYYTFNDRQYLICSRNEPLVKGYKCVILPVSSLSIEEKESHAFPPVYLLLADQVGIRAIVINGDVY